MKPAPTSALIDADAGRAAVGSIARSMSAARVALLRRLAEYRRAARRAATAGAPLRQRLLALMDLAAAARREDDPMLRRWAERVIYEEARPLLEDPEDGGPGDAWERAQRRLRADGHVLCPTCHSPLASDLTLERFQRRREAMVRREAVRAGAVERAEASVRALEEVSG